MKYLKLYESFNDDTLSNIKMILMDNEEHLPIFTSELNKSSGIGQSIRYKEEDNAGETYGLIHDIVLLNDEDVKIEVYDDLEGHIMDEYNLSYEQLSEKYLEEILRLLMRSKYVMKNNLNI